MYYNQRACLLLLLVCCCNLCYTQLNWTRSNPGGGGAFGSVGAGPTGIILAGSDLSGAFVSHDDGLNWRVIGSAQGFTNTHVGAVGFDPSDEDIFYIGSEVGIFRTDDGGENFQHVLTSGYVSYLTFSKADPNIGYAAYHPFYNSPDGVIYKTMDRGQSWSLVSTDLPTGRRLLEIQIDTYDPETVFVLSGKGRFACTPTGLYRSKNGGINWTSIASTVGTIMDFAMVQQSPDTLYLTTMNANCSASFYWTDLNGDLLRSIDGGDSWSIVSNRTGVIWPAFDNPDKLRLIDVREPYQWISTAGTWTSLDGGSSWTQNGDVDNWDSFYASTFWSYGAAFDGISKTLGEDMSDPDRIFWVTSQWVHASNDGGTIFNNQFTDETAGGWQSRGLDNVVMFDIAINPTAPDTMFQAYADIGLWRSLNGGLSWQSCNTAAYSGGWSGYGGNTASVLTDPSLSAVVWAVMQGSMYSDAFLVKSTAAGTPNSWVLSANGLPSTPRMSGISIDPNSPASSRTLFMIADGDVYKSIDGGTNWSVSFADGELFFTAVDPSSPGKVYAGGSSGFFKSDDGGLSWNNTGLVEMGGSYDVFWSRNYRGISDIFAGTAGEVYLTAFGPGKGLYKSSDYGDSWTKIKTDNYMRAVAKSGEMLVCGSASAYYNGGYNASSMGIQYSFDEGMSWQDGNTDMSYPFANCMAFDGKAYEKLFVGSPGPGFQWSYVGPSMCENNGAVANLTSTIDATSIQFGWDPVPGSFGCQLSAGPVAGGYPFSRQFWGLQLSTSDPIPLSSVPAGAYQAKVRCGCALVPALSLTDFSAPHYFLIPEPKLAATDYEFQQHGKTIEFSFEANARNTIAKITNLSGQVIWQSKLSDSGHQQLQLPSSLSGGLYLLSVGNAEGVIWTERLIIN